MKLDAPKRDMHDDQVLSVALAAWWREQSPETRPCGLFWAIHDLWLLASMGAHDADRRPALWISTWEKKIDYGSLQHTI
jgi:hypothetical protein